MLDTMNVLVNKLSLQISRAAEGDMSILDSVRHLLHEQICDGFEICIPWQTFTRGGKFRSQDNMINAQIASVTSESRVLWALKLQMRDAALAKRLWTYHLGIRVFDQDSLYLCYARCCYDHLAGSVYSSRTFPLSADPLPEPLLFSPDLRCMCGKTVFPVEPLELRCDTVSDFLECFGDPQRTHPLLLITCADAVSPAQAAELLLGNAIVYWCTDAAAVMHLNSILPEALYTPWDSVRAFLPVGGEQPYHPCWLYEDIHRMGREEFLRGLRQAYCATMRSLERKNFLTIEDVFRYQDQLHISELSRQLDRQKSESIRLLAQNADLSAAISDLQSRLQTLEQSAGTRQLQEFESLLNECMAETDALKKGISSLCERLYCTLGAGFHPDESEQAAPLQELAQAIYAALACAASRKG